MSQFLKKIAAAEKRMRDRLTPEERVELDKLSRELKDVQIMAHWDKGYTPGLRDKLDVLRMAKQMKQMHIKPVTEGDIIKEGKNL